jgi:hypothetical protein
MFSCNRTDNKKNDQTNNSEFHNHLLPTSVSIMYEQPLEVPQEYFFFKGFAGKSFLEHVVTQSINGSLKASYPFSTIDYTTDEVKERIQSVKHEITNMIFDEDWQLDTTQFKMKKYVRSYTLVREYVRNSPNFGSDTVKSLIATFNAPQTIDVPFEDLTLLARDVAYEVPLINEENPEWVENMPRKRTMQLIIDKLLNGEQAYSFYRRDTLQPLSLDAVKLNLGEEVNYEIMYDELNDAMDTIAIPRAIDINEFVGLVFIEDWYYDKATLRLYKDVKGIAPVRQYEKLLNDGYETVRTMPLMMFFSNHKKGK